MRKVRTPWIMVAAMALIVAACGAGTTATTSDADQAPTTAGSDEATTTAAGDEATTTAGGGELEPAGALTVGLAAIPPVFPAAMHIYAAEDFGYFEQFGIDVTLRPFENGGDSARAVASGEIQVGAVPTNVGVGLAAAGGEMTGIIGMSQPTWHVASTNPDINACEDLEGETIAVDGVGQTRYGVLGAILESCGLTYDDVETVFIHAAPVIEGLVSGQIQNAVMHLYEYATVQTLLAAEGGDTEVHQVIGILEIRPDQHYLYYGASSDAVANMREALVRYVAADLAGREAMADPANLDQLAALGPKMGLEPDVTKTAIELYLGLDNYWATDSIDMPQEKIEYTIQGEIAAGNIEEADAPAYEDLLDESIWQEGRDLLDSMGG